MAERIVSPGVFTQERDLSFLPQGVAEIGAAFVGPTPKGPAFIPTLVDGEEGFVRTFGQPEGVSYLGYSVKNYLQEAGSATVVRVLGLAGYTTTGVTVYAEGSTGKRILAVLHPTIEGQTLTTVTLTGTTSSFGLTISGSTSVEVTGISAVEGNPAFITNVIGTDPQSATQSPAYVYAVFPNAINQVGTGVTLTAETTPINLATQYKNATTPWIRSQPIGGEKYNLFKVHTLNDGTAANREIKVSIVGISPSLNPDSEFGTFSLLVRDFNDTDSATNVLEQWSNLTLDPSSPQYIARVIGDSAPVYNSETNETTYEGDYRNNSQYIRIEMSQDIIPDTAVPYGFAALRSTVSGSCENFATGSFVTSRWTSNAGSGYSSTAIGPNANYYGFNFSDTTSRAYLGPIMSENTIGPNPQNSEFNIESLEQNEVAGSPILLTDRQNVTYRRFSVPFQGGFDGFKPNRLIALGGDITATNSQGFDLSTVNASGSIEYKRALSALANPDSIDMNLLIVPGAIHSLHPSITQTAINICENRGDCFYILDLAPLTSNISTITNLAEDLDTNYAAAYYPWVRVVDTDTNKAIWAPPSVVLPEVYKYSDNVGAEWFAPAGLNRGGIPGAVGVKVRLNQAQRDELYESKVNPIAQFPGQGICVWGQKTLQRRASALDRVNVRRLLITVKKFIASSARFLVFEQNTEATRNRFLNIVNPYLAGIQQRSGLTAFRVVMDETNNTPDLIDRNILKGAIYLQPTRTAEFIMLDFNILPTGARFDTI
jgi:hypothetical protein